MSILAKKDISLFLNLFWPPPYLGKMKAALHGRDAVF